MNVAAPMQACVERLQSGDGERWRRIRLAALSEAPHAFGTTYAEAVRWPAARWEAQVLEFATFSGFRRVDDARLAELAVGELRFSRSLAPPAG